MDITPTFIHKTTWNKVLNYIAASDEIHQQCFLPKRMYEKLMKRKLQW